MSEYYSICEICGDVDIYPSDNSWLIRCENGHSFCDCHILDLEIKEQITEMLSDDEGNSRKNPANGEILEKYCPICQMEEFSAAELLSYLLSVHSPDGRRRAMEAKLRDEFQGSYKAFREANDNNKRIKKEELTCILPTTSTMNSKK